LSKRRKKGNKTLSNSNNKDRVTKLEVGLDLQLPDRKRKKKSGTYKGKYLGMY
jgi:hypothetical protein